MSRADIDAVQVWLDEAASAMGGEARHRKDVLLELETTIYERLDEKATGPEVPPEAVQDVLAAMGDATEIGGSFRTAKPLVPAHLTRPFWINVLVVFAAHFLLVLGATIAGRDLFVPPLHIDGIAHPTRILDLVARALETLLFDVGLVLAAFVLLGRVGIFVRFPHASLAVRTSRRRCIESACFLLLVGVVVNFFRDDLLALYLPAESGVRQVPLVGPGILANLLALNVWLGLAVVRELAYAFWGERKATLSIDLAATVAGLFCLLRIVATERLVDLTPAHAELGTAADTFGALLNTVFGVIALVTAAFLAVRLVRRVFRLALLRSR